jgi:hypothetical protein
LFRKLKFPDNSGVYQGPAPGVPFGIEWSIAEEEAAWFKSPHGRAFYQNKALLPAGIPPFGR